MSIVETFSRNGFVFPFAGMSQARALKYRSALEAVEALYGDDPNFMYATNDGLNVIWPIADEITRLPAILDRVEALLGSDIVVFSTSMFCKPPRSAKFVSWHQDLTYWRLTGTEAVTVWLALSPATRQSGCMRMLPGSHLRELVPHRDTFNRDNLLTRGQSIVEIPNDNDVVDVELLPGQFSVHHGHTFHGSHPNRSHDRRIGISINYVTPAMANRDGIKPMARLVRGRDRYGHFRLTPPPRGLMHPRDVALLRESKAIAETFYYAGTDRRLQTDAIGSMAQCEGIKT